MAKRANHRKYALAIYLILSNTLSSAQKPEGPKLSAIDPSEGVTTPGSRVSIYGSGFSPELAIYFGGLEAREAKFIAPSKIEVVTPYLRPGRYQLRIKSNEITVQSEQFFTASPSSVDSEIDRAITLAAHDHAPSGIAILTNISRTNGDFQVRAFAHYQAAQIYFSQGDWWRWGGEVGAIFDPEAGRSVQTSWQYRLAYDESVYLLPVDSDPEAALRLADWTVEYDITENTEPRFFRGLVNARYGNLEKAKADSDFILKTEPDNASYKALAIYIAVLLGAKSQVRPVDAESVTDARALSLLGQAAYLNGDITGAQSVWNQEAKAYPLGASLSYWAGKKHFARGHRRVAEALLQECVTMGPNSKEAKEASDLLANLRVPRT